MNDIKRCVITRWRLSNHRLQIEVGRYKRPKILQHLRLCNTCNVVEDETHAIYVCPRFEHIRTRYRLLLQRNSDIKTLLNPCNEVKDETANLLIEMDELIG